MKLFTKEIDKKLFEQYHKGSDLATQDVVCKIFNPYGRGTWYILNSDPEDPDYLWCIAHVQVVEVGSVLRSELENIRVQPFGLGLERDTSFRERNALEVLEGLREGKHFGKGGGVKKMAGREWLYEDENVILEKNTVSDHYSLRDAESGQFMEDGGEVKPDLEIVSNEHGENAIYPAGASGDDKGILLREGGKLGDQVKELEIGGAVFYKGETHYVSEKDGKIGLKSFKQGAWGSSYWFPMEDWSNVETMSGKKIVKKPKFYKSSWEEVQFEDGGRLDPQQKKAVRSIMFDFDDPENEWSEIDRNLKQKFRGETYPLAVAYAKSMYRTGGDIFDYTRAKAEAKVNGMSDEQVMEEIDVLLHYERLDDDQGSENIEEARKYLIEHYEEYYEENPNEFRFGGRMDGWKHKARMAAQKTKAAAKKVYEKGNPKKKK